MAILGDIKHSRVAKSDLFGLTKLGAEVRMFAPETLIPKGIDRLGAKLCASREEAVEGADVVMGLRIQLERQEAGNFPSAERIRGVLRRERKGAVPGVLRTRSSCTPAPSTAAWSSPGDVIDDERSRISRIRCSPAWRCGWRCLFLLQQYRKSL